MKRVGLGQNQAGAPFMIDDSRACKLASLMIEAGACKEKARKDTFNSIRGWDEHEYNSYLSAVRSAIRHRKLYP